MLVLDVTWWVVALCLVKKTLWRVLISLFIVAQIAAVTNELLGRLGYNAIDMSLHAPEAALATAVIWSNLGLAAFGVLGLLYLCVRIFQRFRARPVASLAPAPSSTNSLTRRQFLGTCAVAAPPLLTFGLTGIALGQLSQFRLRRFDLAIPSLPKALDGLTIAHISDMHVGEWTHGRILRDLVSATNDLRADIIVLTGDLINYELSDLPEALSLIKQMQSRYGVWMVEGNHDLYENGMEFERRVKASGVPLLLDEAETVNIRGCPVQMLGIRWMEGIGKYRDHVTDTQVRGLMCQRHPDAFPIFLAHHPHTFDAAVKVGLPLTLTGHTHGGQLMLDKDLGIGPVLFRYWSGHYQNGTSQLVVSNGVGNMFPIRINAPAEIAKITLHCGVT